MSRTIKSLKGILADQGSNAVSILLVFVATPILIRQLGNSDYGFWMTVMQLLGYIGLVDPGLGVQVTRAIAGSEDRERLRRFLATAFYAQLCIAILFLVAGFCLGLVLNRFVALPVVAKTAYAVCYALAVVVGTGGVITAYFLAVLAGHQRLVASSILGSVQQVFGLGAGTFFVWLGAGLWALPIAYLVAGTSSLVVSYVLARRCEPNLLLKRTNASVKDLPSLAGYSLYFQMAKVAFIALTNTSGVVIAAVLGPAMVSVYVVTSRLALTSGSLIARAAIVAYPGISELVARRDYVGLQRVVVNMQYISARVGIWMALVIYLINDVFVGLWVGNGLYGGAILTIAVCSLVCRDALTRALGVVIYADGEMRLFGWLSLIEAVLTVALAYIFTRQFGLAGAVIGPLISTMLAVSPYSFYRVAKIVRMPVRALLWRGTGQAFIRIVPSGLVLFWVARVLPHSLGWLWILLVVLTAALLNIAVFDVPGLIRTRNQLWPQRLRALLEAP